MDVIDNPIEENPIAGIGTQTFVVGGSMIAAFLGEEYFMTQWEQKAYEESFTKLGDPDAARVDVAHKKLVPMFIELGAAAVGITSAILIDRYTKAPEWLTWTIFGLSGGTALKAASDGLEILHTRSTASDAWTAYKAAHA